MATTPIDTTHLQRWDRMRASESKTLPAIGFLTVVEIPEQGLVGGYLVLNSAARPLEFHCTAPVKANRAQEILYGPTLRPYLYGEQIGQTLLSRAKNRPFLAATDVEDVLEARSYTTLPIVFVPPDPQLDEPSTEVEPTSTLLGLPRLASASFGASSTPSRKLVEFDLGTQRVAVRHGCQKDQQTVTELWQSHMDGMDLREPFERIHEAIQEAQGCHINGVTPMTRPQNKKRSA